MFERKEYIEGLNRRERLETLTPNQLVDLIIERGQEATEAEREMNAASLILDGYGTTIEAELDKREKENEQT